MNFGAFRSRAEEIFDEIPPDYREGIDGLEVLRKTVSHPSLPDVYTLGECLSEFYPSEFGGPGEVRSRVVLYYGSFLELSRTQDDWDWEEELFETVTHEVRHHLEHLAAEDALEVTDYAEDQNFARREGERFDPFFFQSGTPLDQNLYEVDGDVFLAREVDRRWLERNPTFTADLPTGPVRLRAPSELADVYFLRLPERDGASSGEAFVVLIRRKGIGEWLGGMLTRRPIEVVQADAEVEDEG